jgi:hypothetical protein
LAKRIPLERLRNISKRRTTPPVLVARVGATDSETAADERSDSAALVEDAEPSSAGLWL